MVRVYIMVYSDSGDARRLGGGALAILVGGIVAGGGR